MFLFPCYSSITCMLYCSPHTTFFTQSTTTTRHYRRRSFYHHPSSLQLMTVIWNYQLDSTSSEQDLSSYRSLFLLWLSSLYIIFKRFKKKVLLPP
ncbi:hypothetical protein CPC08DRAFT_358507 [Agrocybe pediades]|nr:hypothetical protein CPC08DRAFT_358507 [Agrocybe pediades]